MIEVDRYVSVNLNFFCSFGVMRCIDSEFDFFRWSVAIYSFVKE